VRHDFDAIRESESKRVAADWAGIAARVRLSAQDRINEVRGLAGELFNVPLRTIRIPAIDNEAEQFSYLFLHVGTTTESIDRAISRVVPDRIARARAMQRAQDALAGEFDKHVGRARWDLAQRIDRARCCIETALRAEMDDAIDAIICAARQVTSRREAGAEFARQDEAQLARQARVADELLRLDDAVLLVQPFSHLQSSSSRGKRTRRRPLEVFRQRTGCRSSVHTTRCRLGRHVLSPETARRFQGCAVMASPRSRPDLRTLLLVGAVGAATVLIAYGLARGSPIWFVVWLAIIAFAQRVGAYWVVRHRGHQPPRGWWR
jgi:hypothetical protein